MKKYLMKGMAAMALCGAFVSCSHDVDFGAGSAVQQEVQKVYEEAFVSRFGEPVKTQTWGFGSSAKAGTRTVYADGNEWAAEGWSVPDTLTDAQKYIVMAYFQNVQNPRYIDPEWTEYFIQQVYKGGTTPGANSTESYTAADGSPYNSSNMDHLAAVDGEFVDHNNNFNGGDCGIYDNVLDNGGDVNNGPWHSDKINLMTESTTKEFGYFNSAFSYRHTDYTGLVGWETIYNWAKDHTSLLNGYDPEELKDKWNRSYMGFDFELKVGDDIYAKDNSNNQIFATINEAPGNPTNVLVGSDIVPVSAPSAPAAGETLPEVDLIATATNGWAVWNTGTYTLNGNNTVSFTGNAGAFLVALNYYPTWNLTSYSKIAIEFESPTPTKLLFCAQGNSGQAINETEIPAGTTSVEIPITSPKSDITQLYLKLAEADGSFTVKRMYLPASSASSSETVTAYGEYLLYNDNQVPCLINNPNMYGGTMKTFDESEIKGDNAGKVYLKVDAFTTYLQQGYLPIAGTQLKTWVKPQAVADGYYSDWIVTLTKANTIPDDDEGDEGDDEGDDDGDDDTDVWDEIRVIAEDLTVDQNTDFDFNDVVFDVRRCKSGPNVGKVEIVLQAAGGTLPLYVNGTEVHGAFGEETNVMINTKANMSSYRGVDGKAPVTIQTTIVDTESEIGTIANSIEVYVIKKGEICYLTAPEGEVASKVAVGTDYEWCDERQDIDAKYSLDDGTSLFKEYVKGRTGDRWYYLFDKK